LKVRGESRERGLIGEPSKDATRLTTQWTGGEQGKENGGKVIRVLKEGTRPKIRNRFEKMTGIVIKRQVGSQRNARDARKKKGERKPAMERGFIRREKEWGGGDERGADVYDLILGDFIGGVRKGRNQGGRNQAQNYRHTRKTELK